MNAVRRELSKPLARWGFTGVAILGALAGQLAIAAAAGVLAVAAWRFR